MSILDTISSPADLRRLSPEELTVLGEEIRAFILEKVSEHGGHLSPNLGVVELTLALHRVFDSPNDRIIWDVGHQAYVHKLVTGRMAGFDRLRATGGSPATRAGKSQSTISSRTATPRRRCPTRWVMPWPGIRGTRLR